MFLFFASCDNKNSSDKTERNLESVKKDSIIVEGTKKDSILNENDFYTLETAPYVGIINSFYESDDYYIDLYYAEGFSDDTPNLLAENHGEIIYQGQEMTRTNVPYEIAKNHLEIEFLDTMYVFNERQELIDSISLQNIEYLDAMIESKYIASYSHPTKLEGKIAISKSPDLKDFNKSPSFKEIENTLIKDLKLNIETLNIGKAFKLYHKGDTFNVFSFSDKEYNHQILLLKNGVVTDKIFEYYIDRIQPVPIASDDKIYYNVSSFVPDTDNSWTQLLGIDLEEGEFIKNRGNRLK